MHAVEADAGPRVATGPKPYLDISTERARLQVVAWIAAAALAAAEATVLLWDTTGIVVHGLLVLAFLLGGGRTTSRRLRALLWSLAVVPTIRLAGFGAPLDEMTVMNRLALVGGLMLLTTVLAIRAIRLGPRDLGLTVRWRHVPLCVGALVVGTGLGIVQRAVVTAVPFPDPADTPLVATMFLMGIVDDLFYLGLLVEVARRVMGGWAALFVGMNVAALQIGYGSWRLAACALVATLLFAWVRQASHSVVGAAFGHLGLNVGMLVLGPAYAPSLWPAILSLLDMMGLS